MRPSQSRVYPAIRRSEKGRMSSTIAKENPMAGTEL
jgi:hypothetical protein